MFELIFPLFGVVICALVVLQLFQWSASSLIRLRFNRQQFEIAQEQLRQSLDARQSVVSERLQQNRMSSEISDDTNELKSESRITNSSDTSLKHGVVNADGSWQGFREFEVFELQQETKNCKSVYLRPVDGQAICDFRPGQHLTLEFNLGDKSKGIVRCYSLSNGTPEAGYRISVKRTNFSETEQGTHTSISNYVNDHLNVGDVVRAKQPAGDFCLDQNSNLPMVLLAGGIGITPLLSMIESEVQKNSDRLMLLVYGVRDKQDHAFREHLQELQRRHRTLHVVNVYSAPSPGDKKGVDYHLDGRMSVELLKSVLPSNQCQFYLCGPPLFMKALYPGLLEWGVPDESIFFESFGPAAIKRSNKGDVNSQSSEAGKKQYIVSFTRSGKQAAFENAESVLECAEALGVQLDSGCRSGNCGTCQVPLQSGEVSYGELSATECEPGSFLPCIAKPVSDISVEA